MALYVGGASRTRVGKDQVLNKAKGNSFWLSVVKKDEYDARAAINSMKGTIKYQGYDEGTWTRYRFYFYTPLSIEEVKKFLKGRLSSDFGIIRI